MSKNRTHLDFGGEQNQESDFAHFLGNPNDGLDEEDSILLYLSKDEQDARNEFLSQVRRAFSREPDLNGVIRGVRKIALGKKGSRSGYFPSTKNAPPGFFSVSLPVESRLEARYAMDLERNPNVRAFRTQAIELAMPGLGSPAYPDFLILDIAGYLHVKEVKQNASLLSPEKVSFFEHIGRGLSKWGFTFAVVDAADLPSDNKYANLQYLNKLIRTFPSAEDIRDFLNHKFSRSTYGELKNVASQMGFDESIVSYLLFVEELQTNWEQTLTDKSEVTK